jgi:membrane-associated protein
MFGISIDSLIQSGGLLLIAAIIFAESGLLIGFFLPGDTLLIAAGVFAAQGKLSLPLVIVTVVVAAFIGDNTGYLIGERGGRRIFKKEESFLFHPSHVLKAEAFYEKHGGKTIMFARFVPIVRTFAPLVAGVGKMPRKRFIPFDIVGCIVWGAGVTLIGYWFGSKIPNIDHYILPVIVLVMFATFVPALYHLVKEPSNRARIKAMFKKAA